MGRKIYYSIMTVFLIACITTEKTLDASALLNQSIAVHDKNGHWSKANLEIHIQEPRVSNPKRYSVLRLNNKNGRFELSRGKENHIVQYIIDEKGKKMVLLDDKKIVDSITIKKYKLNASRNSNYKNFYAMMYGLPMSIPEYSKTIGGGTKVFFNKESCYKIEIELKEPIITKFWNVYISQEDSYLVGIEIFHENDIEKGERIYFENLIEINGMKLPRIKHWLDLETSDYGGSDIIIKELNKNEI